VWSRLLCRHHLIDCILNRFWLYCLLIFEMPLNFCITNSALLLLIENRRGNALCPVVHIQLAKFSACVLLFWCTALNCWLSLSELLPCTDKLVTVENHPFGEHYVSKINPKGTHWRSKLLCKIFPFCTKFQEWKYALLSYIEGLILTKGWKYTLLSYIEGFSITIGSLCLPHPSGVN